MELNKKTDEVTKNQGVTIFDYLNNEKLQYSVFWFDYFETKN
jgi:hypothetical protein